MICFAILAHENEEVLVNQIKNIKYYNPGCKVILYNGGLDTKFGLKSNIPICPKSRPLKKEKLGRFFLDIMTWLEEIQIDYDYLVNLDSDVMFIKKGYEKYLNKHMQGYDCMGINMGIQRSPLDAPHWVPGMNMWSEWAIWQPFFGTDYFCGSLNSMQVYRKEIVKKMITNLDIDKLETLFQVTDVYALEEILYATLAVRCGGKHRPYPSECAEFVGWTPLSISEIEIALENENVFFVHPIERTMDNPARKWLTNKIKLFSRFLEFIGYRKKKIDYPSSLTISWACYQGGVETALYNRLRILTSLDVNAHAYFYHGGSGASLYKDIPYHISSIEKDLGAYIQKYQFNIVTFINTLYNIEELERIDYQGKVIFEFHGYNSSISQELYKINSGQDKGYVKAIVVPSSYVAEIAKANLTNRKDLPIFVARNPIDTSVFYKQSTNAIVNMYPKLKTWKGIPIIGWVGRLDSNKNWEKLLSIFTAIKTKNSLVKLAIVSDITSSPDVHLFNEKVLQSNLSDEIILLPNVPFEKMPSYYSLITQSRGVFLSTSLSEGYPLNLLEAQACECPIVCTDIGGSNEIVTDKLTGFTFPVINDNIAILQTQELLNNSKLRKKVGKRARKSVLSKNNLDQNIKEYLNWITNLGNHEF
ncbi:glycosyltransferase [Psychrobacillus sp. AK 1817]|uniref:glycosyltransferase family 4 protein n=1 Tax=Psychrobacillus sp. AK 1817 TaxID=2303505 RepID=UPI001244AE2F|nr:glycosyltransferase family 4 protein [Psychrobacillus sp. AK 1817]QEY21279.1 glycosyltransferase [Psychrobacillus sp. AK 1817]